MNMFKRSLAMILVLIMLIGVMPVTALANDSDQNVAGASAEISTDENYDAAVISDEPETDEPEADEPKVDEPEAEEPKVDEPEAEEPKVDEPEAEEPKVDEPEAEEPKVDEPEAEEPKVDEPEADEPETDEPVTDEPKTEESDELITSTDTVQEETDNDALNAIAEEEIEALADVDVDYRILHLDCGRKYFTKDWIIALINEMKAAGYNQLQLAFGNDGLRFLLDDMSFTANGTTYSHATVVSKVEAGNSAQNSSGDTRWLTQAEMDAIIAHAKTKNIEIVPLLNLPGHANAILDIANDQYNASGSNNTLDVANNSNARAFGLAIFKKYVDYFAGKGCKFFSFGADEYANDAGNPFSFSRLSDTEYATFVFFINELTAYIEGKGMTARAFNDGLYYNGKEVAADTDIQCCYWSSGWGSYPVASASTIADKGHAMINTHGDYYMVLNTTEIQNPSDTALNFDNTQFMNSTISNPVGSMFCIWCDIPGSATEQEVAAAARITLRKMAAAMQNTDSYSTEVVPGGFNADGTIAVECNNVTVKDETSLVEVTGCDLTSVTAVEAEAPTIEGAANVKAWNITPYVGTEKHTTSATVKVPVPAEWDTSRLGAFLVEADNTVTLINSGNYADGYYTFKMNHFSVGGIYEAAPTAEGDTEITENRTIDLILGETKTDAIQDGDYTGTYTTDPEGIATVTAVHEEKEGNISVTPVTSLTSGNSYYIMNSSGEYLAADLQWVSSADNAVAWKAEITKYFDYVVSYNGAYLGYKDEWLTVNSSDDENVEYFQYYELFSAWMGYNSDAKFTFAEVSGSASVNQTTVTFTGTTVGSATVDVGPVCYTVNVKYNEKTITIAKTATRTEEQSVTVAEYMDVASLSNDYVTATWTGNTVTFTAKNQTGTVEMIIGNTKYTVNVIEENLDEVSPLTIEYWLTNAPVVETQGSTVSSKSVTAVSAYSESGIDVSTIIPSTGRKTDAEPSDPDLVYWHTRLLPLPGNQQTSDEGDDETLNGISFTKVRYWNGSWAVYTEEGAWQNIEPAKYQLVAYYMNDLNLADEVAVRTADWGKKGNGDFGGSYLGSDNVSLAFQVVYEDGTTAPAGTGTELAPYTYFVDHWGNRGVGTIGIDQIGDYQIWKITAETGEHNATHNGNYYPITLNGFTWDKNEMTVWEDAENPVSQYTIQNPSSNPNTNGYYDNLRWNERNESILIRIYIKAVETEDSLTVVYYDEKFGDTLYTYNISVESGKNFTSDIVGTSEFAGNSARIDVTNASIVNALGKTQNFQTDLTQVPEAVGKYNSGLYTYNGSEIRDDGKTLYLYYTINTNTLSPNFVADFGLPLSFRLSDVVGSGQEAVVESVTVDERTRYGTLDYNESTKIFTYTPTRILRNIDVLSINIKFTTETAATLTNVGVTPATTVYYGEQFLNFTSGWTTEGNDVSVGKQAAEVLGKSSYYGYDAAYASTSGASDGTAQKSVAIGDRATFTFTGTGIQVFANSTPNSGYASVTVKNHDTGAVVKVSMVDTVVSGTTGTETTGGQVGKNLAGLPIVSLVDLTGLDHATYDVTISKVMDTDPVYIDGIRVFETVEDQSHFVADKEDNPDFFEVRDVVMKAIGIKATDSVDYETMYKQVYADTVEVGGSAVITSVNAPYGTTNLQDLLDNGPKNELYLFKGDTLTMNVSTNRVVQLGLKAPEGSASFTLNGESKSLSTTVDMFYKVADKSESTTTHTITVENTGDNILSVTLLKVCDDPNFAFVPLTEANIKDILADAGITETPQQPSYTMVELKGTDVLIDGTVFDYTGEPIEPAITVNVGGTQLVEGKDYTVTYTNNVEPGTATVTVRGIATASETLGYTGEVSINYTINAPEEPEIPEETTKPEKPGKPEKPEKPEKPGNNKPSQTKATAELMIELVDYSGKKIGTAKLSAKGISGDTCFFKAEEILEAAESKLSAKYAIVNASAITGVETVYGENSTVTVRVGKIATLKITYVNLFGKKVGTATITDVQTAGGYCGISAFRINAQAPSGRRGMWLLPAVIPYGNTASIIVPVI